MGYDKPSRVGDAVRALTVKLTPRDVNFLDERCQPHERVGPRALPCKNPLTNTDHTQLSLELFSAATPIPAGQSGEEHSPDAGLTPGLCRHRHVMLRPELKTALQ